EDRAFWSFRPLARPSPPEVRDAARCQNEIDRFGPAELDERGGGVGAAARCHNEIDRFVQAKREERGVAPAAPASRRSLLRRAWFDLVGLPPPPEEGAAFVADGAGGAGAGRGGRGAAGP